MPDNRGKTGGRLTVGMEYDSAACVAGSTPRTVSYWVEMSDLLYQPDPRLLAEIERLRELEKETLARWGESSTH